MACPVGLPVYLLIRERRRSEDLYVRGVRTNTDVSMTATKITADPNMEAIYSTVGIANDKRRGSASAVSVDATPSSVVKRRVLAGTKPNVANAADSGNLKETKDL